MTKHHHQPVGTFLPTTYRGQVFACTLHRAVLKSVALYRNASSSTYGRTSVSGSPCSHTLQPNASPAQPANSHPAAGGAAAPPPPQHHYNNPRRAPPHPTTNTTTHTLGPFYSSCPLYSSSFFSSRISVSSLCLPFHSLQPFRPADSATSIPTSYLRGTATPIIPDYLHRLDSSCGRYLLRELNCTTLHLAHPYTGCRGAWHACRLASGLVHLSPPTGTTAAAPYGCFYIHAAAAAALLLRCYIRAVCWPARTYMLHAAALHRLRLLLSPPAR